MNFRPFCALPVLALLLAAPGIDVARAQAATSPQLEVSAVTLPDAPTPAATSGFSSSELPDAPSAVQTASPTTPLQPGETEDQRKERERLAAEAQVKAEEKQRIGGVLPNFNTVIGGTAPPISAKQKWDIARHSAVDPYYFGLAFISAGIGEIDDSHPGYHWGAQGYFKRVGANFVDNLDGIIIGNALLPSVLHQDPRYFRKGTGSIPSRIVYSALSAVICRGDNGHKQFNISNVGGNLIAGAISNIYYPSNETGVGLTFENALQVTYVGAIGAQLLEFSPDITTWWHNRHQRKLDKQAAATGQPAPAPAKP